MYCSPHPAALHIAPAARLGILLLGFRAWEFHIIRNGLSASRWADHNVQRHHTEAVSSVLTWHDRLRNVAALEVDDYAGIM
jgi:hypothetical protein